MNARLVVLLLAVAGLAAVALLSAVTIQSQGQAREEALERFDERGEIVARLLSGDLSQSIATATRDTARLFSGEVTQEDLQTFEGVGDATIPVSAVLDDEGEVLASNPPDARVDADAETRAAIEDAIEGDPTMTNVIEVEGVDAMQFVVPFTTADGQQRIFVVAFTVEAVASSLSGAVGGAVDTDTGAAFVFDTRGERVLALGDRSLRRDIADELAAAVRDERGSGEVDGVRYVTAPIDNVAMHFAYAQPESDVHATLPESTWPRIALAALALSVLALLFLGARALRDARRLELARREADRANDAKSHFLTHVSHELKTPLAVIRGFADLLLQGRVDSERQQDYIERIRESSTHLSRLADDLLEVSRIESGEITLALERVDAGRVVGEVLELTAPLADDRQVRLERPSGEVDVPAVIADQLRLRQVLLNLVSNAIKYNGGDGLVRVELRASGPYVRISVLDTGPGIAPDDLPRLFLPFERLHARTGDIEGTGLGLAVSKGLVEAMDGRIDVESRMGDGSTFWFELPAAT